MKHTYPFRVLVLGIIASVLLLLTAAWGWFVYGSLHRVIIEGFDKKLLAISGTVAELLDSDWHERYQRRRFIHQFCAGPDGSLRGIDAAAAEWVSIDTRTGVARSAGSFANQIRGSLATDPLTHAVHALDETGRSLLTLAVEDGRVVEAKRLSGALDGVFYRDRMLMGWKERRLYSFDKESGNLEEKSGALPAIPQAVAWDPAKQHLVFLANEGKTIVVLDDKGVQLSSTQLKIVAQAGESDARLTSLAWVDGRFFGAGESLLAVDPSSGKCQAGSYTKFYFDMGDPFYARLRDQYIYMRRATKLTYLYTSVYTGGMDIYYVLDGTEGATFSPPGATDTIPNVEAALGDLQVQYLGKPYVSKIQKWDQWGLIKTSAYPIRSRDGRTVAIAGADVDMTTIRSKTRWALFAVLLIGVCSLAAAVFVSIRVARRLTEPLLALKMSALRMAAGEHLSQGLQARGTEAARLASILDRLGEKLQQHEAHSQRHREELRSLRRRTTIQNALQSARSEEGTGVVSGDAGDACRHAEGIAGSSGVLLWVGTMPTPTTEDIGAAERIRCLSRQLVGAVLEPEECASLLLAASPSLDATAHWSPRERRLHYNARRPAPLRTGRGVRMLEGSGVVALEGTEAPEWSIAASDWSGAGAENRRMEK